jgi:hypothetical protein
MQPHEIDIREHIDSSALTGWLHDWYVKGKVSNLRAPLAPSRRSGYFDRIDSRLPQDYLECVAQTEGVKISTCLIHGASEIRKIILPDANYYMLADLKGQGALLVKEGNQQGELYFNSYEDDELLPVGKSLQSALAKVLKI